ncbi:AIR synthase family protein [Clostridium cylindrosporum]|uniref:Hydrogenase maturation factor n=1 Tax=Clostridium cylindrosporum DSM 605 TaxID=1121307 RepID=A0A0J8DGH8_CLOCY|nr:AIR synthase family protein [Clostridium cylindrosporum]KMT23268.1 hydrogenase maturation factor [Clostridium cylindrosporum DSM 605]
MKIGKLPNDILKNEILSKININSKDVLVGPGVGEDCSIVDFGDEKCVITTDPITGASNNIGALSVHISCNDIASAGVKPIGVMVTILAPPTCELEDIKNVMDDVVTTCKSLSVSVLGGHTEITDAVNKMIVSITAIGKGRDIVSTKGAKINDDIVVTGYAGLEGTVIIASDKYDTLLKHFSEEELEGIKSMLQSISVVETGLIAAEFGVNSMHDATEGGILGAIWEVGEASELSVVVEEDKIPIKNQTKKISKIFNLDPYKLISSGSMIITTPRGEELVSLFREKGINSAVVGKITTGDNLIIKDNNKMKLTQPESDEIYKI